MQNIEDIYELSPMQQGMLFHTLYAPNLGMYFVQLVCTLNGNLNVLGFKQAWEQVVARHQVLRSSFHWEEIDKPLQVVDKQVELPWVHLYWYDLTLSKQQEHLKAFLQADQEQAFDLNKAPLMRCSIIQVADDTHLFVWSFHHLLMDGWSFSIIFKEVFAFYNAINTGNILNLKSTRPYHDYIIWLQQQDISKAESFWRQALQGFTVPTPLVVDKFVGNNYFPETYDELRLKLSTEVTDGLKSLARKHHFTLNTIVQGAWALLLLSYSGESDVVFGATVSGRPPALLGVESMVGLFINTLPVRVQISKETELLPWLKDLQAQQVEREQYSYSPLVEIQGWSDVPRGMPMFESIVVFENYPLDASWKEQSGGLEISHIQSFERTNYPLTVGVALGSELSVGIIYNNSRFEAATIRRIIGHFQTLLEGIVANPRQLLSDLPLLTECERHQLLVEFNNTQFKFSQDKDKCIHHLFEAQVERTPDAVAVVFKDQQLTYRELNTRANQLAHYLQTLGVESEVLVGLCVERSLEMLVGLLGILKAGGAYVPFAPAYPKELLTYMLNNSQVPVLLTLQKLVTRLPEYATQVVCLDTDWKIISQATGVNPLKSATVEKLAYVIYTSGSTGKPKGVMIQHQSLVNFTQSVQLEYELDESDRVLQFASISFDTAAEEIYPCLTCGGALVLRTDEMLNSVPEFLQKCRNLNLTVLDLPTAYWHQVSSELARADLVLPNSLRLVIIGGEQALLEQVKTWQKNVGSVPQLVNTYGPTEATVVTTLCKLLGSTAVELGRQEVPIGRPIHNVQVYVLDKYLQPTAIGVHGELHIGGAGLARGYLNHPELTKEKFIPNPFSQEEGARLYKTGDLVRYLPDGNLEFLGRIDHQVKIRGFRIELGEIESMLNQHPKVQQAIAIAREDTPNNKRLVAYIVPQGEQVPTQSELRQFLQEKLPEYMVPSVFLQIETMPLTSNGKIDHRALPAPNFELNREASIVYPRDAIELQLAQIWEEFLDIYPIGVRDNFFDLGGHSILATSLMARIQKHFEKNVPIAALFKGATIEHLASILRSSTDSPVWSTVVPIQPGGFKRPFFCVHPGGSTILSYFYLARYLNPEQPFYGLESMGLSEEQKPYTRVEDMAAYYIEAMRIVQPQGPYLLGGWSFGGLVAFEIAQQLHAQDEQVPLLVLLDTSAPEVSQDLQEPEDAALLLMALAQDNSLSWEHIQQLSHNEQFSHIVEYAKQANWIPPDYGLVEAQHQIQFHKRHIRAGYNYRLKPFPGKVTLLRASKEAATDTVFSTLFGHISRSSQDLTLGWGELAAQGVEILWVCGDHMTMMTEPYVQVLAKQLQLCLDQAQVNNFGK